jgi:hypothetical protein
VGSRFKGLCRPTFVHRLKAKHPRLQTIQAIPRLSSTESKLAGQKEKAFFELADRFRTADEPGLLFCPETVWAMRISIAADTAVFTTFLLDHSSSTICLTHMIFVVDLISQLL